MARDARYFGLASRIAAENGANIVKTYYCDGFEKVVAACPVPVVIAGGKKLPELEALELTIRQSVRVLPVWIWDVMCSSRKHLPL